MANNYSSVAQSLTATAATITKGSLDSGGVHYDRTTPLPASTATRASVAASATAVTLLAANANRLGASVTNDGSTDLHIALGAAAATTTDYTAKIAAGARWDLPFAYTGVIGGIWAGTPTGSARVTELTP